MQLLDKIPLDMLAVAALALGLAPFVPEPHLWQKLKMLADGSLSRPIDIFDLFLHGAPVLLLGAKLGRIAWLKSHPESM
ncbi:RND transporter [Endothiovibrio diazotrophicus]